MPENASYDSGYQNHDFNHLMKHPFTLLTAVLLGSWCSAAETALVPVIQGEWIHVYQPQPDAFPGPDSPRFKTGKRYGDWQVNDHCILKEPDQRWHAFGITHPAIPGHELNPHEGEWMSFHAVAGEGTFKQHAKPGAWKDHPKILPPSARPGEIKENHAPFTVFHDGQYWMFYGKSPIRYATEEGGGPESPSILALHGGFYLIWCRWDPKLSKKGFTYQDRSFVFFSNTPMDFKNRQPVAEIQSHAPELFQDEDGDWWISSAERPNRGVSIAPVKWQPMTTPADVLSPAALPPTSGSDKHSKSKPR
jgi:beta-fructofuranosidase